LSNGETAESECSLLCNDIWRLRGGYLDNDSNNDIDSGGNPRQKSPTRSPVPNAALGAESHLLDIKIDWFRSWFGSSARSTEKYEFEKERRAAVIVIDPSVRFAYSRKGAQVAKEALRNAGFALPRFENTTDETDSDRRHAASSYSSYFGGLMTTSSDPKYGSNIEPAMHKWARICKEVVAALDGHNDAAASFASWGAIMSLGNGLVAWLRCWFFTDEEDKDTDSSNILPKPWPPERPLKVVECERMSHVGCHLVPFDTYIQPRKVLHGQHLLPLQNFKTQFVNMSVLKKYLTFANKNTNNKHYSSPL